ncbi:MAG: protein kinase, partial [Planctomycetes bacterium]|nr:protein kinase [Planctomycetota bacterium]
MSDDSTERPVATRTFGPQSEPIGVPATIGRYRIVRTIGEGGMGVVLEAVQENPRRRVAIKVLSSRVATPAILRRFKHEAQILGQMQHPGIAQIFEAGTF